MKKNKPILQFNWKIGLGYIVIMVLLISLGNWQIRRAHEKEQLQQERQTESKLFPVDLNALHNPSLKQLQYRRVKVKGVFDIQHQILIDNQMYQGKVGYYVMTPLKIEGKAEAVLVNRGWVPMNKDRRQLPDIGLTETEVLIRGRVNHFPQVGYMLDGADIPTPGWPTVVQVVNTGLIAQKLGYALLDFQVEMDAELPGGYVREWRIATKMPPEKHYAYAMQWYGLALTLTLLMIWMSFKKTDE
ncbi:SURF1 family protein [methane-oxidizing endosymbiont of Gigantopelta aegis]|uniref:SURF1 family protein n=1 Tax=methane-oxidizing endosymbiont of Gigantopelta aegis TaxID=2794938 RepID=UPI0018DD332B|nr:SURF1 family protein [methane-oxidizing endosymbiont of Gigantopelta aegis]